MSEQTANGRNANGHRFRLYEIIIAGLLGLIGVVLTVMLGLLIASDQRTANRVEALDRKVEALDRKVDEKVADLSRKVEENSRILVEVQTTLKLIASGLDLRGEPKEQAGPAATPAPNEKLATKNP